MNSKQHLVEEAERLFIYELLSAEAISKKLNLNRKTVNNWRATYEWDKKKKDFFQSKQSFHNELYEFARKLMRDITEDIDNKEKVDPGRMYAFCKIIPLFTKVKSYEDIITQKDKKETPRGLTPEIIAQIEEEVLGIKPSESDNIDYDEEI